MKKIFAYLIASIFSISAMAATLVPVQLLNPTGSTSGQAIISTGASTAPTWGNVTATALAAQAANTVVANVTASSASPTAVAMPTCNTSVSALNYTPVTGWTCNTGLITAATVSSTYAPLASPALTGTPTAPTAAAGTNTTQLATTAYANTIFAAPPCYGCTTAAAVHATTLAGSSLSKVYATKATAQSLPNSTQTTVTTWTTVTDANSNFNASTGTFTAPATGDYLLSTSVVSSSGSLGATSQFDCVFLVNGTDVGGSDTLYPTAGTSSASCNSTIYQHLTSGQTVNVAVFNGTGVALNTTTATLVTNLSIVQLP